MLTFKPRFPKETWQKEYEEYLEEHREVFETVRIGEANYQEDLGWFNVAEHAGSETLTELNLLAQEVRVKADVFIVIGVGGSNNGARSVIKALQSETDSVVIYYSGNQLSPYEMIQLMEKIKGKSVYIHPIAKNFATLEPGTSFRILRDYLYSVYDEVEAKKRMICTGTLGSDFEALCQKEGYRFLSFPKNVGGRFSALTAVGLFPMTVAGISIEEMINGAKEMESELKTTDFSENCAYAYASYRQFLVKKGYRIELLATFEPRFRYFSKWWIQLFAESEGKEKQGLFPSYAEYSEDLHSLGQYVQEGQAQLFETFLHVNNLQESWVIPMSLQEDGFTYLDQKDLRAINKIAYDATIEAHASELPVSILEIDSLSARHFGALFYFFEFSCYLSARLMTIHPFNQPGVEAYKALMNQSLRQ